MKKFVLLTILSCLSVFGVLAQKRPTPDKSNMPKQTSSQTSKSKQARTPVKTDKTNQAQKTDKNNKPKQTLDKTNKPKQIQTVDKANKSKQIQKTVETDKSKQPQMPILTKISETEWKNLIDALKTEDWEKSAFLSTQLLSHIKTDDEKKRLAQLRYFYLFALAGKIFQFSSAGEQAKEAEVWKELDRAVGNFIGKELILPPRRFLGDCSQFINYICRVKDNERALRVTATNSGGTVIHSFEYVSFEQKIDLKEFAGKETFLGGRLRRAEFNNNLAKPWIMRLFFEGGFVRVIMAE